MELWDVLDANRQPAGRFHLRGVPLPQGDYHLVVYVWVVNRKGEYLISRRTPNKTYANLWECTGGSAIRGDTSLAAARREVQEELGIDLDPANGELILSLRRDDGNAFNDVWLFRQEVDLADVVLQEGETCDARWAKPEEIRAMLANGEFVPELTHYLDQLFAM